MVQMQMPWMHSARKARLTLTTLKILVILILSAASAGVSETLRSSVK